MIKRFYKVNDFLYRGGAPSIEDVIYLNKAVGIKKIISLDGIAGKTIDRACKLLGIKHIIIPININKKSSILSLLKHNLYDLLMNDGPTFIHCVEGKDRTGIAIALFRCQYEGWSCKKALAEAKSHQFGLGVDKKIIDFYKKILNKYCGENHQHHSNDINEAYDIVSNQLDYRSDFTDYTLDSSEQQSFAPFDYWPIKRYPDSDVYYGEQYPTRNNFDLKDYENMETGNNKIPQIGIFDNTSDQKGIGPVEIGGGFV